MTDSTCPGNCCESFPIAVGGKCLTLEEHRNLKKKTKDHDYIQNMLIPTEDPYLFNCKHFDKKTRLCGDYENRPKMCSGYPYKGVCERGCGFDGKNAGTHRRTIKLNQREYRLQEAMCLLDDITKAYETEPNEDNKAAAGRCRRASRTIRLEIMRVNRERRRK